MSNAPISGQSMEGRAATNGGNEDTKFGNPNIMFPQINVSAFWDSSTTGKSYARTDWPPEVLKLRLTSPATPAGTHEIYCSSQGWKAAEEKPYSVFFRDSLQNSQAHWASVTFRHSQGQQHSSLEVGFLEVLSTTISHRECGCSAPLENRFPDAST